jgi:hypothetical protein
MGTVNRLAMPHVCHGSLQTAMVGQTSDTGKKTYPKCRSIEG